MGKTARQVAVAIGVLVLVAFGVFVWPTPYRDFALRPGPVRVNYAWVLAARQHRVSGRVDILTRDGWRPLTGFQSAIDSLASIAADPLDSLIRARRSSRSH